MKKIIVLAVAIFITLHANAQNMKVAHFDINYVLPLLPKFKKAEEDLKVYSKQIEDELKNKQKEFEEKYKVYQEQAATWDKVILAAKQEELQSLERQIIDFEQKAQGDIQNKQQEMLAPIYEEIEKMVKEVANAQGYTNVFRTEACAFGNKNNNISDLVLKKLGVTPPVAIDKK